MIPLLVFALRWIFEAEHVCLEVRITKYWTCSTFKGPCWIYLFGALIKVDAIKKHKNCMSYYKIVDVKHGKFSNERLKSTYSINYRFEFITLGKC